MLYMWINDHDFETKVQTKAYCIYKISKTSVKGEGIGHLTCGHTQSLYSPSKWLGRYRHCFKCPLYLRRVL